MNPLLETVFGFAEDPFNPATDPRTKFDFVTYSPKGALRIFEEERLKDYFIEVACFKECLDQARNFLSGRTANQGPPAFLIEGLRDSGVESLANYIAWLIARNAPGNIAGFDSVRIIGENFADWLNNILISLRLHLDVSPSVALSTAVQSWFPNPQAPVTANENSLVQLMTTLSRQLKKMPWLILTLVSVNYDQKSRMKQLADLLTPMNIAPIFVTSDPMVSLYFQAAFGGTASALKLRPLNASEGADFLKSRMEGFRSSLPTGKTELFPYQQDAIDYLFSDGAKVVGYLLEVCDGSLQEMLKDLESGKRTSSDVTWEHVRRCIKMRLKRVPPERKA